LSAQIVSLWHTHKITALSERPPAGLMSITEALSPASPVVDRNVQFVSTSTCPSDSFVEGRRCPDEFPFVTCSSPRILQV
jgi:hypothetical protein